MINILYDCFKYWSEKGGIWLISDTHFGDSDCKFHNPDWISPDEQVRRINNLVGKNDTLIHLGDVGNAAYIDRLRAGRKVLLLGNHDRISLLKDHFDEIYSGPLFISSKILLSHEPICGLNWCVNIHGHDHASIEWNSDSKHVNLVVNLCDYAPVNLGTLIKNGLLSDVDTIHRKTIDRAIEKSKK